MRKWLILPVLFLAGQPRAAASQGPAGSWDQNLRLARKFVMASDRYLHHDRLKAGMSGYGLTVVAGTKVEKFNATVLSVMRNWSPHRDVVLCKLSGLGLERTGIVAGMSGSPVFIKDPADGKFKMIGAVAYGWRFQKEPICGVQPIAQMLAIEGVPLPGRKPPKTRTARPGRHDLAGGVDPQRARAVLNPRKVSFAAFGSPRRAARPRLPVGVPQLVPLATPVMAAGVCPRTVRLAGQLLAGTGLVPLQAGAVGKADARRGPSRLVPGSALAVTLVSGDSDWAAVGTVTEVIGERVLAFGHSLDARGIVELPMGPAYVHAVIPSAYTSFKLSSTVRVTGALTNDEYTGVAGRTGRKAPMVPLTVTVRWGQSEQKFTYRLVRHNWLTASMASLMLKDSLWANRDLPERHSIDYTVDIDFGPMGKYHAANFSSANYTFDVSSDLTRPLAAMMNTPLGQPVFPRRMDVKMTVHRVRRTAEILALTLERHSYRPGQTLRGKVLLRPFRARRTACPVAVTLPKDLPDGRYTLTVSDAYGWLERRRSELPHRFKPRTVKQLFRAVQEVVKPKLDRLYAYLAAPAGGLAVSSVELEHLPASLADVLSRTAPTETTEYKRSVWDEFQTGYVLAGKASAEFLVEREPRRKH